VKLKNDKTFLVVAPKVKVVFATVGALHVACDWIHGEGEGEGAGVDVHNMRLNTAHCALVLYGVHIAIATPYADATHSGSCKTAAVTRTRPTFISRGTDTQQAGGQRGGARHSGAPMLRRYETTSALLQAMAYSSAVVPPLQGR
jgi:hypothetical protein